MDFEVIRALQANLPWGKHPYSAHYLADPRPHRDFTHAVVHIGNAAGFLLRLARGAASPDDCRKRLADVVICAVRAANEWPSGRADLHDAVWDVRLDAPSFAGAAGRIAEAGCLLMGLAAALEHGDPVDPVEVDEYRVHLAEATVYAFAVANRWPGRRIDMATECAARLGQNAINRHEAAAEGSAR